MDIEFFERKIKGLSDSKLNDLLKLRNEANRDFILLATSEAIRRGMDSVEAGFPLDDKEKAHSPSGIDLSKLETWNWAPVLLGPVWALATNLKNGPSSALLFPS
jgi:hypothetical protein